MGKRLYYFTAGVYLKSGLKTKEFCTMLLRGLICSFLLLPSIGFSEVGFRDLKIGSTTAVIDKQCEKHWKSGWPVRCYGIDDLNFEFSLNDIIDDTRRYYQEGEGLTGCIVGMVPAEISKEWFKFGGPRKINEATYAQDYRNNGLVCIAVFQNDKIVKLTIYSAKQLKTIKGMQIGLGPLYQTNLGKIFGDPDNPYVKLKTSLGAKYQLDWEFTERDRKLFNEGAKSSLWTSYNNGQIFSQIYRIDKYSNLKLFVHYHTKEEGAKLSDERRPKNVKFDNF
jgi:hypothetical protein